VKLSAQRLAILVGTLALCVLVIRWCRSRILPAPEAIQIALDDAVAGAENNDVSRIMQHISADFRLDLGGEVLDRRGLKQRLFILLRRGVSVEIVTQDVQEFDNAATVTLVVAMWSGGLGGAASGDATAREIELDFRVEGSDWKVVEARQRAANIDDVF